MREYREPGVGSFGALVLCALVGGCAAPTEIETQAALPLALPTAFGELAGNAAAAPLAADLEALGLQEWWLSFGATELNADVLAALGNNRDLLAAAARVEAARAQTRMIAGARLPEIGAGLELSRARRNYIGLPIPGAPEVLPVTSSQHGLGLELSWEVDLWQRLASAERAAVAEGAAIESDRRALALALAGQTVRTWLSLAHQDELLAILTLRCAIGEEQLAWARNRYAAGSGDSASITRSDSALASLRARCEQEQAVRSAAQIELDRLCGRIPRTTGAARQLPAAPVELPAGIPAEVLERRPDLRAAAARVSAARARSAEAAAARLPRLQLTASGGTVSAALGDLLDGDFRVWGLAAGLTAPIFDGGRLRAQAEGASALAEAAETDYVARALLCLAEVETALAAETRLRAATSRAEEAVQIWQSEAAAAHGRFTAGTGDAGSTLARADALLEARAAALSLRFALLLNRVDLLLALGGDFASPNTP